jgi:hypothetical protein
VSSWIRHGREVWDRVGLEAKHPGGRTRRQQLIVWRPAGELDDCALHGSEEGLRDDPGRRAGGNRPHPAAGVDQAGAALHEPLGDPLEVTPDGVILTAELEPEGHRHAGDVAPAVNGVAARESEQRSSRIGLLVDEPADLLSPCLVDPIDHRQGEILLVPELVIERSAGVAGLARHFLQVEVAVAVARESARGSLEQGAARAPAPLRLR